MLSFSEITERLQNAEQEYSDHCDWYKRAREKYDRDKKNWGSADYGECEQASVICNNTKKEIEILKWVLDGKENIG